MSGLGHRCAETRRWRKRPKRSLSDSAVCGVARRIAGNLFFGLYAGVMIGLITASVHGALPLPMCLGPLT